MSLSSEPRGWYEKRNALQKQQFPELNWATPKMVSQVDALRVNRGQLPSQLTRDTTQFAADIAQSRQRPPLSPPIYPVDPVPERERAQYGPGGRALARGFGSAAGAIASGAGAIASGIGSGFGAVFGAENMGRTGEMMYEADVRPAVEGHQLRALGTIISQADRPISERLGIEIPEMRGPFDELANFALDEVTRPTNYLFALAGGPVATQIARIGGKGLIRSKAARGAAALLRPASASKNPLVRSAAEVGEQAVFRGASEGTDEVL